MPASAPTLNWGRNLDQVKRLAVERFELRKLGWRGFDALPWVAALLARYAEIHDVLLGLNVARPQSFAALTALAERVAEQDRSRLRDYIAGKLALEEFSCLSHGAGAGACDRRAALTIAFQMACDWS